MNKKKFVKSQGLQKTDRPMLNITPPGDIKKKKNQGFQVKKGSVRAPIFKSGNTNSGR